MSSSIQFKDKTFKLTVDGIEIPNKCILEPLDIRVMDGIVTAHVDFIIDDLFIDDVNVKATIESLDSLGVE